MGITSREEAIRISLTFSYKFSKAVQDQSKGEKPEKQGRSSKELR